MFTIKLLENTLDVHVLHLVAPESFDSHHELIELNRILSNSLFHISLEPLVDARVPRA